MKTLLANVYNVRVLKHFFKRFPINFYHIPYFLLIRHHVKDLSFLIFM